MSGTAALAAARKRRATPDPRVEVKAVKEVKEFNVAKSSPTNPALLLLQHNHFIQKLQQDVAELKNELKNNESKDKESSKEQVNDNYKTEYLGLLEEMKEMKKVLLKVQSFSMETNLDVMKLKRLSETNIPTSPPLLNCCSEHTLERVLEEEDSV
uniref:Uncharacterized protein n=1 Tax=viral metagenome TaxID=1070528 RepID=A0A6C0ETN3_9ZZZZ